MELMRLTTSGARMSHILKEKTRKKPIPLIRYLVQVIEELVKLHKEIYLTADKFFVKGIPLFLTLSRKILFTAFNHIQGLQRDIQLLHKPLFPYQNSPYIWIIFHTTSYGLRVHYRGNQDQYHKCK